MTDVPLLDCISPQLKGGLLTPLSTVIVHKVEAMSNKKKKTIRKHELREEIRRLQLRVDSLDGALYGTAIDIFEDLRNSSDGRDKYETREKFREMTLGVSLKLFMFLKKEIPPMHFKYSYRWYVYFGTDEEFEEHFTQS